MPNAFNRSAAPRPAFSISTTPDMPNSSMARRSRLRSSSRLRRSELMGMQCPSSARAITSLPANPQALALEKGFHLVARNPIEIARDRMFERAGGDAVIQALLQIRVQEAMDKARGKRVASAETVHDYYFEGLRSKDRAFAVCDGGPAVFPDERVLA